MIHLEHLSKGFGGQTLFQDVHWFIPEGERYGLVGPNGVGKTTLFRIIMGEETADSGRVVHHGRRRVGYLPQEIDVHSPLSVIDEVIAGRGRVLEIEREMDALRARLEALDAQGVEHEALTARFGELEGEYAMLGGYSLRADAERILSGMGFSQEAMGRPLMTFSGGWQMRALLSRLLLSSPDLLLLDEPTNHLDLPSVEWLESFLREYPGTVILISHDRYFLNRMVTRIAELSSQGVTLYTGDYDDYVEQREERFAALEKAAAQQQKEIAKMEAFVERFRYKATKARQAQSRLKQLEKIERIEVGASAQGIHFTFPQPPRSGRDVLELRGAAKSYGANVVYTGVDLRMERGEKVALVGPNGAGKTTLLKMLAGVETMDAGELLLGHNVSISYFAQHAVDALDPSRTVLEALQEVASDEAMPRVRSILGAFLFSGDAVNKKVMVLSGGEKNRLALARMLLEPRNLLLLDEPTNHLDIQSCDVLEDALQQFQGTICFISHDRHFINTVATRVIHVEHRRLYEYQGDYEYYRWKRDQERDEALAASAAEAAGGSRKDLKRRRHELRQQKAAELGDLKVRLQRVEDEIAAAEARRAEVQAQLGDPALYNNGARVRELTILNAQTDKALETLFAQWEDIGSRVEAIETRYAELERELE